MFSFQSCQEATSPEIAETTNKSTTLQKSVQLQVADLDLLAKNLASAFKNKMLRKILSNDTKNSMVREHILDAKTFLEKDINVFNKPTTFKSFLLDNASLKTKSKLLKVFNKLKVGNLDIYFPVHDHLNRFNENIATLRVGYINPWEEWDPINVYSIDGKHEKLDAHTPPKEPVLMVNFCEHHGNHKLPLKSTVNTQTIEGDDDGGGGGGSGGSGSGGSGSTSKKDRKIYFEWISFDDWHTYEPWGSGDPEWKMFFAITSSSTYKLTYKFGDEYGWWNIFGYHAYISSSGWNHKHQYYFTINKNDIDKEKYYYGSVKLIEEDKDCGEQKFKLEIPLDTLLKGAKATWEIKFSKLDDEVGENTFIKLWDTPDPADRNTTPIKHECSPVGDSYVTFWWEN